MKNNIFRLESVLLEAKNILQRTEAEYMKSDSSSNIRLSSFLLLLLCVWSRLTQIDRRGPDYIQFAFRWWEEQRTLNGLLFQQTSRCLRWLQLPVTHLRASDWWQRYCSPFFFIVQGVARKPILCATLTQQNARPFFWKETYGLQMSGDNKSPSCTLPPTAWIRPACLRPTTSSSAVKVRLFSQISEASGLQRNSAVS